MSLHRFFLGFYELFAEEGLIVGPSDTTRIENALWDLLKILTHQCQVVECVCFCEFLTLLLTSL